MTLPTTRFVSRQPLPPGLIPSHHEPPPLQPAHWPLIWMLILTQASVGILLVASGASSTLYPGLIMMALAAGVLGTLASITHLGRPSQAWRSFLGLRRSWLSREIVLFGLYLALLLGAAISSWGRWSYLTRGFTWAASWVGVAGMLCSGMVYHVTGRIGWRGWNSLARFAGTTVVLGLATARCATGAAGAGANGTDDAMLPLASLDLGLALAMLIKLAGEHRSLRESDTDYTEQFWARDGQFDEWSLAQSAGLRRGRLGLWTRWRFFVAVAGGIVLPGLSLLSGDHGLALTLASGLLCLGGEVLERFLFFRAVVPARMPGV